MTDSEDLNTQSEQNKRKKKSPIELRLGRTRGETKILKNNSRSEIDVTDFTCESDSDANTILTGRRDTRFIMSTASSTTPTTSADIPLYVQSGSTPTQTTTGGLIKSRIQQRIDYDQNPNQSDLEDVIARAVRAAEVNSKLRHHEEVDNLKKQIESLKIQLNSVRQPFEANLAPTRNAEARARAPRYLDSATNADQNSGLNTEASVFTNQQGYQSVPVMPPNFVPPNPYLQTFPRTYNTPNTFPPYNFQNFNYPPPSYEAGRPSVSSQPPPLNESYGSIHNKSVPIHKWKIRYNGDGSVSQFLFKVNALRRKNFYEEEEVFSNFDMLLEGRAETFFWRFVSVNPTARYPAFVRAFSIEFGSGEKDCMVMANLAQKRQGINESFTDFLEGMRSLLDRMEHPIPDASFISLVKANCKPELSNLLYALPLYSKEALSRAGKDAEQQLNYQNKLYKVPHAKYETRRMVSELTEDNALGQSARIEELESKIEAIKFQNMKKKSQAESNEEEIKGCYNCRATDHFQRECPHELTEIYCFRCGKRGYITPKCPRCLSKNRRDDDVSSGTYRQD